MQLLIGMLDSALARQQDLLAAEQRTAVALKIDEAPLVLNRGFAETMALKRSAGLETVACWQTDSQWVDPDVRDQLDALFAHRVYFATASARDARTAVDLTMTEFSDTVRPAVGRISSLGHPDVRLHLPKHHAIVSWSTEEGRQSVSPSMLRASANAAGATSPISASPTGIIACVRPPRRPSLDRAPPTPGLLTRARPPTACRRNPSGCRPRRPTATASSSSSTAPTACGW
jgi:hypothetical protein